MYKWEKRILIVVYLLSLTVIICINSSLIVDWLNKSLFVDFSLLENLDVRTSFYSGASLVVLIFFAMYAIFGTFIVSLLVTNLIFAAIVISNQIKVKERNEFITFKELQAISSPKELLSFVDIPVGQALLVLLTILSVLVLFHYVSKKIAKKMNFNIGLKTRVGILLIALVPLIVIFVHPDTYNARILKYEKTNSHNFNPVARARQDGFIPSFVHTIKPDYMQKPANYNRQNIERISSDYLKKAKSINSGRSNNLSDSQTILYLSETLMDPKRIPDLLKNETPIPYITDMQKVHSGGTVYSQYIGGGTANIEWSVLTSFSLELFNEPMATTPYSDFYVGAKNHHSILNYIKNDKVAIHPYTASLYRRKSVYREMGFDDFLYLDNGIQHTGKLGTFQRVADEEFHKDILRVLGEEETGFIHALSMQNHSPFNGELPDMQYSPDINFDIYPEKDGQGLVNYLKGTRASDEAIRQLIEELSASDKDINLMLYGDHFPSLFRGKEEQFPGSLLHETPWLLYMNNGRSEGGINLEGISPMFLTTVILKEGDYFVSPFHSLMDQLLESGVKRIGKDFIVTDAGRIADLMMDPETRQLVEDYRMVVYDALFGSNWLPDDFFNSFE
ncbi:LTA synthase family protein [Edaphobacillus lindanitolerans]|uniref:Phosphoglycerol transferase MdoB n=1 Tax=Edaphobacillus lindanitolerans TaxID=550447 RepID=A0A1U7PMU1_9BACI|nr:alkaline phosphatase family protein [Edaphobacillus lindanitolerans]SIT70802.1 Phosphoglycerol transferase MdoB [Edaphobacillus lindanitolerans]